METDNPLEFMVTTKGNNVPKTVQFEQLYGLKPDITSVTLLWNTNCYHVNVPQKVFIINGGRRIVMKGFEKAENIELLYARRNTVEIDMQKTSGNGQAPKPEQSYLLGFQGMIDGEKREIMLHISEAGELWYWRDHR